MISSEARSAARALLFAMDIGAKGADIREKTQRLLYALGDEDEMPQRVDAARLVAAAAVADGAMPMAIWMGIDKADMPRLKAVARSLDSTANLDRLSFANARFYVVTLALARVHEGVLCA